MAEETTSETQGYTSSDLIHMECQILFSMKEN